MKNIQYSVFVFLVTCILGLGSCIPIRKQLILINPKKPSLSSIQKMDTIVNKKPFEYRIRCGDRLTIGVQTLNLEGANALGLILSEGTNNQNQNNGVSNGTQETGIAVNDSGYVNLPILGSIYVKNKTIEEVESTINSLASNYYNHTRSTIKVGFNYTLFILNSGGVRVANSSTLTMLDVITQNNIPEFGNIQKIRIIRKTPDNRGYHIYYLNLNDIDIVSKEEFYVLPGDIIIIEPYRLKNFNTYFMRNVGLITTFLGLPLVLISLLNTYRRI